MNMNFRIYITLLMLFASLTANSQSPKKYLKNGFYEKAFVEAVHKQNRKVKLKKKHTEVIYESYKTMYAKHTANIISPDTKWDFSYNQLIRMVKYRAKVTHPGVSENLGNLLHDQPVLEHLAKKFNEENKSDIEVAKSYESVQNYEKAFDIYKGMKIRHDQAEPITTLSDRLILIDCEAKIKFINQKIGDQYILEAKKFLKTATKEAANSAIELIKKARSHRPLDLEEEELLTLANLIIGESWLEEAKKLMLTPTKKNARLAYELINRARSARTLTAQEEELLELAESFGMTRVFVKVKGDNPVNDASSLSGVLNKSKNTNWVTYYFSPDHDQVIDFEMEISEKQPKVVLGNIRRQVKQNTKNVEYWEEEIDDEGNTVKVKKTRLAVAMVAIVSRTKTANMHWSLIVKDLRDGNAIHSESKETKIELLNEYVSLESGDILALPDNIESDIELDSQPFPSDQEMLLQVKDQYLSELMTLVKSNKDHMRNLNVILLD